MFTDLGKRNVSDKRIRCDGCFFLVEQCVCPWVPRLSTRLSILILQDPKEAKHAKNTVSLLRLGLPVVECIQTTNHDALFCALSQKDPAKWRLLFPNDGATAIESMDAKTASDIEGLIVLDATWRKAKKLYLTEPLLQNFESLCFARPPGGQYHIRKSPSELSLSTLEASAYAIEQITGDNMQSLREFMLSAQAWQWRQQPLAHRHVN